MLHFHIKIKGLKNAACSLVISKHCWFFFFCEIRGVLLLPLTEVVTHSAAAAELFG